MLQATNIDLYVGEDYLQPFVVSREDGVTYSNINGWTIQLFVSRPRQSSDILLTKTALIDDGANGKCSVAFDRADTVSLPPGDYSYNLAHTDDGENYVLTYGYLILRERAT